MATNTGSPLSHLVNLPVSHLAPYSGLILTVTAVVVFLVRFYALEKWLMNSKWYRKRYQSLNDNQRRSFVNHHMSVLLKVTILATASYPFIQIFCVGSTFQQIIDTDDPDGVLIRFGDLLIISSNIFTTMYIFELFYRNAISPIGWAHHMGAIIIAQTAIVITFSINREQDAIYEFAVCLVWGAFDVLAEFWPHLAMIFYRMQPDKHLLLARVLLGTAYLELASTIAETGLVFWIWGSLWHKWSLTFKIVTPILHCLFTIAQLWGCWILRKMSQQKLRDAQNAQEQG